nr:DNA polymerase Y family protein [Actinomyces sp.]
MRQEEARARLIAVWVPDWPVAALDLEARRGPGAPPDPALVPVAVVGGNGVVAASPRARAAGVRTGMRLRRARSLCPELTVLPSQPEREARSFEHVMQALSTVLADPVVARPGLALSGARGPARWTGSEEEVAESLVEAVAQETGAECLVGIADSLLACVLAARRGVIVPAGQAAEFLSPWPVSSLLAALATRREREQMRELTETLVRLGLRRLGDLVQVPEPDVTARFGPLGQRAHRLASGRSWILPRSSRPETDVEVVTELDPPVARADAAAFAARHLAEDLVSRLLRRGLVAGRLRVEAGCEDGSELSRFWMLESAPTSAEVTDRVRWQLEGWLAGRAGQPPSCALVRLSLTAMELSAAGSAQTGLWAGPREQTRRRAYRAAQRVESLLGAGEVRVPVLAPGRDPRSRGVLVAWGEDEGGAGRGGEGPGGPAREGAWEGALPSPSPALVPAAPVPARLCDARGGEVEVDAQGQLGSDPQTVTVLRLLGAEGVDLRQGAQVRAWAGPWPVDEGWWRPQGPSRRAYLQVVTEQGSALLLVRAGRWWVDGVYC